LRAARRLCSRTRRTCATRIRRATSRWPSA
jgi:hypothetical protein